MTQRPVIPVLTMAVALAACAAGCHEEFDHLRPPLPPPVEGAVPLTPFDNPGEKETTRKLLVIRLRLITVQLPMGSVSDSEEIWSYLDEEPVGARIGSGLAHNGIRVGLGRESAWPDIARILRQLTGSPLRQSHTVAYPGAPLPIVLKHRQGAQTIFTFRPDRTLFGRDYPPGDNILTLTAGVNMDRPADVQLACSPAIRATERRTRYVRKPSGYVLTTEPDYYPLRDLEFQFRVDPGGFVLIGPGAEAKRPDSPGQRFLIRQKKGAKFETILVIAPEVFYVPIEEPRPAAEPSAR